MDSQLLVTKFRLLWKSPQSMLDPHLMPQKCSTLWATEKGVFVSPEEEEGAQVPPWPISAA